MIIGANYGVNMVNQMESICDDLGAVHVCLLLGNDIFEYGDKGYFRHKNVGKTSEYDWDNNFEIEGETKVSPDELEAKINENKKKMISLTTPKKSKNHLDKNEIYIYYNKNESSTAAMTGKKERRKIMETRSENKNKNISFLSK